MKFFVDQNLGSLTRWLRFLGFDVAPIRLNRQNCHRLPQPKPTNFILTRQTSWPAALNRQDVIILASDRTEEQLAEICRRLQLSPETWLPLKRCSSCNKILQPIAPDQAEGRVPDYISLRQQKFFECPQCRRVYWEGSHQARIRSQLEKLQHDLLVP